jgi:FAD/FMN-containing dehydrogenase
MIESPDSVDTLRQQFSRVIVGRNDPGYDEMRAVHNGLIDKRPALIATATAYPHREPGFNLVLTGEWPERVRDAYGPNWDRLVALKRRWDPDNVFHLNQNIDPSS